MLLEKDLLEYIEGERSFKTTPKGIQLLHVCNDMEELMVAKNPSEPTPKIPIY